ncbi:hypothetical protein CRUP_000738, partial [Coryphaenoides rupestris]
VQYSDGQSGKEFVTYLTLSPVQMTFHGTGSTLQASHDQSRSNSLGLSLPGPLAAWRWEGAYLRRGEEEQEVEEEEEEGMC